MSDRVCVGNVRVSGIGTLFGDYSVYIVWGPDSGDFSLSLKCGLLYRVCPVP